ncbi:MAG: putative intracellular septation protein A [Paracoccaceae bacterium]|nr:MAG: septation protein A [Alphaproteobacteria bacterium]GIX13573.1 MAG: putative intracellular septation protein A [Paracoccaceae bacterium]
MTKRQINPLLRLGLEIGPLIAFFVAYRVAGGEDAAAKLQGMLTATAVFVPLQLGAIALSWRLSGHLPRMAVLTAVVVVVFGGLTLALRDDMFIKMKPTVIYALFAAVLGFGLWRRTSYLQYLMGEMMPLDPEGWMKLTRRFALFFLAMAVANEAVWRLLGTDAWVTFKTFVTLPLTFGFMLAQTPMINRHMAGQR